MHLTDDQISTGWAALPDDVRRALEADPRQVIAAELRPLLIELRFIIAWAYMVGAPDPKPYRPTLEPEVVDWLQHRKDGQKTTK